MTDLKCPELVATILVLAGFGICTLIWPKGSTTTRMTISVLGVLGICVLSFVWGPFLGGPDKWNILMSVATLLAVIGALLLAVFHDEIQTLRHHPKIEVNVANNLIEPAHGKYYIRGTVKNIGDRRAKRCRVKLLRIEGQDFQTEQVNFYLAWQGQTRDFLTLYPDEFWIFDIGTRNPAENAPFPLRFSTYIGTNDVSRELAPRELNYRLILAVYGDNIPSTQRAVSLRIRAAAANDIQISLEA